ncbi:MAG: serpin family protein [Isosphaeraceae bacterium]
MRRLPGFVEFLAMLVALGAGLAPGKGIGGDRVATSTEEESLRAVVEGNTRFAFDLYARLRRGEGNHFFSPYSLSTALAMTSVSARGETDRELAATLGVPADPSARHQGFHALISKINGEGEAKSKGDILRTANALWLQKGETILAEFLETTRDQYGARASEVDFRGGPEAARGLINGWVEEQTEHKIRDLVRSSDLNPQTSVLLTNAVYFKGAWQHPFRPAATRNDAPFVTAGGETVKVALMVQSELLAYHEDESFQMLELPYVGRGREMVVLLPRKADGLDALEGTLTGPNLAGWLGKMTRRTVNVELPRFKLTEEIRPREVLREMGLATAFDPARADFSGLTGRRDHAISEVIHKAFVDVNETGTEAAAATGIVMSRTDVLVPERPVLFRADHPFLFLIRDRKTGSILFLGRVSNPTR